jgi:vesicle coat complex subunit
MVACHAAACCESRLPQILEYVLQPIRQRLADQSAYVRKTAVLGVAKLFTRNPKAVKGANRDIRMPSFMPCPPLVRA